MKALIDTFSWRMQHIDCTANASDFYYVRLARRLYDAIRLSEVGKAEGGYICEYFALYVTYYFEDVVSGIGVWQTFTSKHKELYGKYLPFYDLNEDEYYQDEINFEDIRFLLWMILQKEKKETFLNPENPFMTKLAKMVYKELDAEFEKAPVNIEMLERLRNKSRYENFFEVKSMLMHIVSNHYLFEPFLEGRLYRIEDRLDTFLKDNLDYSSVDYAAGSIIACCEKTGPLSLYGKDWLAAMLAHWGLAEESERVAAIEFVELTVFLLKGYDAQTICLQDIKGEEYVVPRDSFQELADNVLQTCKSFIGCLVKYDGTWQVNGMSSWSHGTQFFDGYKEAKVKKACDPTVYNKVMEVNDNHPLLYFKDYVEVVKWLNTHIGLAEESTFSEKLKEQSYFAVYVDKAPSMSIHPYGALVIKDEHNPYYDKETAEDEGMSFIASDESATKELIHYLIDHNMLPDARINSIKGAERGKQLVQENIDFMARFMRVDGY